MWNDHAWCHQWYDTVHAISCGQPWLQCHLAWWCQGHLCDWACVWPWGYVKDWTRDLRDGGGEGHPCKYCCTGQGKLLESILFRGLSIFTSVMCFPIRLFHSTDKHKYFEKVWSRFVQTDGELACCELWEAFVTFVKTCVFTLHDRNFRYCFFFSFFLMTTLWNSLWDTKKERKELLRIES